MVTEFSKTLDNTYNTYYNDSVRRNRNDIQTKGKDNIGGWVVFGIYKRIAP